jgi:hypothetical protein
VARRALAREPDHLAGMHASRIFTSSVRSPCARARPRRAGRTQLDLAGGAGEGILDVEQDPRVVILALHRDAFFPKRAHAPRSCGRRAPRRSR